MFLQIFQEMHSAGTHFGLVVACRALALIEDVVPRVTEVYTTKVSE